MKFVEDKELEKLIASKLSKLLPIQRRENERSISSFCCKSYHDAGHFALDPDEIVGMMLAYERLSSKTAMTLDELKTLHLL